MEDKKCRICGLADMANTYILANPKLMEKIITVFPIIMYPNDPLPKHICRKCIMNTTNMFTEVERALRNQTKWIANVRGVQPDNQYVKVVDSIEGANKQTSVLVSNVANEDIGELVICRQFNFKNMQGTPVTDKLKTTETTSSQRQDQSSQLNSGKPTTQINQLKSVLELNGCTLTKLRQYRPIAPARKIVELPKIAVKQEPAQIVEIDETLVECRLCPMEFETVEELAIHQLNHLSVSVPRVGENKCLDKRIRRGRLIRVDNKKCIRCLNCWRLFADNKSILHHWSTADCDFYCQICGKEFTLSPKMLREHVPAAHGISYRSAKSIRLSLLALKKLTDKSPAKLDHLRRGQAFVSQALSIKVACNICKKVFANFKAKNSHMRAHKQQLPYLNTSPPSLSESLLALNCNDVQIKEEPSEYATEYQIVTLNDNDTPPPPATGKTLVTSSSTASISDQLRSPESATKPPTGIRTKFVNIRPKRTTSTATNNETPTSTLKVLKVKSLVDLQDPSVSSQQSEDSDRIRDRLLNSCSPSSPTTNQQILMEPTNEIFSTENINGDKPFNCHPCRGKFSSKLELFRHKRKCTANNLFPCQFCAKHFLTSADLQMHIMLLHKNHCGQQV